MHMLVDLLPLAEKIENFFVVFCVLGFENGNLRSGVPFFRHGGKGTLDTLS